MALIKCPECGKEISDKSSNCIHCGYPLSNEENSSLSPTDFNDQQEKNQENQNKSTSAKLWGKLKAITALVNKINPTIRIFVSVILIIVALVCLVQGKNALNNDRYDFYKEHYQDCIDGYEECKANARTAGYLFKSTYESLADDYEKMAEDDLAKINSYRIKAIVFYVSFVIIILIALVFIHGINLKKSLDDVTGSIKRRIKSDMSPIEGDPVASPEREAVPLENGLIKNGEEVTEGTVDELDSNSENSANNAEQVEQKSNAIPTKHKKPLIIVGLIAVIFILLSLGTTIFEKEYCEVNGCDREVKDDENYCSVHICHYGGCSNKSVDDGLYCYSHTCKASGCNERIARALYGQSDSEYCSNHQSAYNSAVSTSNLTISNKEITHNSSYTVFTATISNNGAATYKFVTVKGAFVDKNGTVHDTDSTYAVGSEGLAPGESTSFRMSIPKDRSVTNCNVSIVDYDIDKVNTSLIDFD